MWINRFETEPISRWALYFWQPLDTAAPQDAHPYCCLINKVVFYEHPLRVRGQGGGFEEHDRVETEWDLLGQRWTDADVGFSALAPFVLHDGEIYELTGGKVLWRDGGWWMKWRARRLSVDDHRYESALTEALKVVRANRDEDEAARILASLPVIGRDGTVAIFVKRRERPAVASAGGEGEG